MSAYVVSPTHIDALLSIALNGTIEPRAPWRRWRPLYIEDEGAEFGVAEFSSANADEVGADLLDECIESVAYRYPDDDRSLLPGSTPTPDPGQYQFTDLGRVFSLSEALLAIQGYEYQACEHPGWSTSRAYRFCAELRSKLVDHLIDREADTWEVTAEKAVERLGIRA